MITRFYLRLLSTNVKHPKFGCHVTSLCQGLRRSAGSGGEDPENQVVSSVVLNVNLAGINALLNNVAFSTILNSSYRQKKNSNK